MMHSAKSRKAVFEGAIADYCKIFFFDRYKVDKITGFFID